MKFIVFEIYPIKNDFFKVMGNFSLICKMTVMSEKFLVSFWATPRVMVCPPGLTGSLMLTGCLKGELCWESLS